MATLAMLPTPDTGVQAVLDYCKKQNPRTVVVFMISEDGCEVRHSEIESITTLIGALERTKHEIMSGA